MVDAGGTLCVLYWFMKYSLNREVVTRYWKTVGYQLVHNCLRGYFARSYKREWENNLISTVSSFLLINIINSLRQSCLQFQYPLLFYSSLFPPLVSSLHPIFSATSFHIDISFITVKMWST